MKKVLGAILLFVAILLAMLLVGSLLIPPHRNGNGNAQPIEPHMSPITPQGGVLLYRDTNLSVSVDAIDWGTLEPADIATETVFIQNNAYTPIILSLNTSDYDPPEFEQYSDFSWNYSDTPLEPLEVLAVEFQLHINPFIRGITDFAFDIIISWEAAGETTVL